MPSQKLKRLEDEAALAAQNMEKAFEALEEAKRLYWEKRKAVIAQERKESEEESASL